jgi:uncharacterized protein YbjT (DUF2867 family)
MNGTPDRPPVFVMGATGRTGGEIARQLVRQGVAVRAGVRDPSSARATEGVQFARFDATDPSTFGVLDGVRQMFLLWAPGTDVRGHVLPLIDEAARRGVRQVVFLSILGAERVKVVPHRAVERHLESSGLDWVLLRSSYFMQNFTDVHRDDVRLRSEIFVPAGRGRTSFVDVRDVAAVAVKALNEGHARRAYDLTGDVALTYEEVALILSVTLGRAVRYADPSAPTFVRTSLARGVPLTFALFMLAEYTVAKLGLAGEVTSTVREVLGRPATSWRQFAEDHREVWQRP